MGLVDGSWSMKNHTITVYLFVMLFGSLFVNHAETTKLILMTFAVLGDRVLVIPRDAGEAVGRS